MGDDDQAIYGWRGADIENLRGLPRDYPNLKLIKLEQNYRSTVRILKAANTLIAHNEKLFDKKLWSDLGQGDPISVTICKDNEKEAEQVVMKLQAHKFEHRTKFSDYAILYRGNFQARALEQHLRDNHRQPGLHRRRSAAGPAAGDRPGHGRRLDHLRCRPGQIHHQQRRDADRGPQFGPRLHGRNGIQSILALDKNRQSRPGRGR